LNLIPFEKNELVYLHKAWSVFDRLYYLAHAIILLRKSLFYVYIDLYLQTKPKMSSLLM